MAEDLTDARAAAAGQQQDRGSRQQVAGLQAPHVAARRAGLRARDELHWKAERPRRGALRAGFERLEPLEERRAGVPGERVAALDHHVAEQRRAGQRIEGLELQGRGKGFELSPYFVKSSLRVAGEIHLVDEQHRLADSQQAGDVQMFFRLLEQPFRYIGEQEQRIGIARAGGHVARVLLVPRGIGDDELAPRRREVAVRHVDGDALLALGLQAVGEERQVELRRAASQRRPLHGRELVLLDRARVVQQPPDERALAVVDAAGGGESKRLHQKYPSFFLLSIEASEVWSSMRVAPRSVSRAIRVSSMIVSVSRASDSTGHVQEMSPTVRKRTETCSTASPGLGGVIGVTGTSRPRRRTTGRRCA